MKRTSRQARGLCVLARSRTEPELFTTFYTQAAPQVYRFFAGRARDGQVAMDLAAETFAKAFEKRHAFRGETDAEAYGWLWAIARNELHQYWRTKRVALDAVQAMGLSRVQLTDDELERVDELLSLALDASHLQSAVGALSDEHQTVLQLKLVEDMDYVEIAEHLGVSNDVVRARLSRGLRALRRSLDVEGRTG